MGMRPSDWEIGLSCSGNLDSGNINHGYRLFFSFHFWFLDFLCNQMEGPSICISGVVGNKEGKKGNMIKNGSIS